MNDSQLKLANDVVLKQTSTSSLHREICFLSQFDTETDREAAAGGYNRKLSARSVENCHVLKSL